MTCSIVTQVVGDSNLGDDVTLNFIGAQENDVVFVFGGASLDIGAAPDTPSGYTSVAASAASPFARCSYKVMGSTPDTSVVCDGGGAANDIAVYLACVVRGIDTSNVLDVAVTESTGSASTPDALSITPTTAGAMVLFFGANTSNDAIFRAPADYGFSHGGGRNGANDMSVGMFAAQWDSGAINPGAWQNWVSGDYYALSVAVRPGASSGGGGGGGIPTLHFGF